MDACLRDMVVWERNLVNYAVEICVHMVDIAAWGGDPGVTPACGRDISACGADRR